MRVIVASTPMNTHRYTNQYLSNIAHLLHVWVVIEHVVFGPCLE